VLVVSGGVAGMPSKAVGFVVPAKQRISIILKRKQTGVEFRVGMNNPRQPNTTSPSGNK